jgi:hypothetical protein
MPERARPDAGCITHEAAPLELKTPEDSINLQQLTRVCISEPRLEGYDFKSPLLQELTHVKKEGFPVV